MTKQANNYVAMRCAREIEATEAVLERTLSQQEKTTYEVAFRAGFSTALTYVRDTMISKGDEIAPNRID